MSQTVTNQLPQDAESIDRWLEATERMLVEAKAANEAKQTVQNTTIEQVVRDVEVSGEKLLNLIETLEIEDKGIEAK